MSYTVLWSPGAQDEMRALPVKDQRIVRRKVEPLKDTPRPAGCRKVQTLDAYRVRAGDWRRVYFVYDDWREVVIDRVRHGKRAYLRR